VSESGPPQDGNVEFIVRISIVPRDDGTAPQSLREALEALAAAVASDDKYLDLQMRPCVRLLRDEE
jgi:hypothetical protein